MWIFALALAQQTPPMDAVPSWFLVIIQGGSFALLAWILIYGIPKLNERMSSDRQKAEEIAAGERKLIIDGVSAERKLASDERRIERKEFMDALDKMSATFRTEAAAERMACEKHFETLANAMKSGNDATMTAVKASAEQIQQHALRNQQWAKLLEAEAEKTKAALDMKAKQGGT